MRSHDTTLPYDIEYQSALIQERLCNVFGVSIMVMYSGCQEMRKIISYVFTSYIQPYIF